MARDKVLNLLLHVVEPQLPNLPFPITPVCPILLSRSSLNKSI